MTRLTDVVTVSEAAAEKDVPADTVRRRILRGALPAIKKGKQWLIKRSDLKAWTVRRNQEG